EYAKLHAQQVTDEFVDPGFSGDTEDRPALKRMLAGAREGRFDVVLVYRFDRIFREVRLFLNMEHELRQHGARLISITEAIDDTHEGRLQLLIKGSFAEGGHQGESQPGEDSSRQGGQVDGRSATLRLRSRPPDFEACG